MTYDEAIEFWFGLINYERHHPKPSDLKLDRMRGLLERLGDPQHGLRIVHVAGTKGKGSTSAMIASILRKAGCRTGLFTSPHLVDVSERIQIDGEPISRAEMAESMSRIAPIVAELRDQGHVEQVPTFFEAGTALGFLHFRERGVDAAVLEVGLGGRFDSTNVCDPAVAVITEIGIDHTAQLGNTFAAIAFEKAGIIKPQVPTVCTTTEPTAVEVIEAVAKERGSPCDVIGRDFTYESVAGLVSAQGPEFDRPTTVKVTTSEAQWPEMRLNLLGRHQAANAAGVVRVVERLRRLGWAIPDTAVVEGLAEAQWPARLEVVRRRPLVILDCAHNIGSVTALVKTLDESVTVPGRRSLIISASADKDVAGIAAILSPKFDRVFVTAYANNPRVVPPEQLAALFQGPELHIHPTTTEAWSAALQCSEEGDLIVIAGSVFLAGELRPHLRVP